MEWPPRPPPASALPFPQKLLLQRAPPSSTKSEVHDVKSALSCDDVQSFAQSVGSTPLGVLPSALLPSGRASRGWSWLHSAAAQGAPKVIQWLLIPGVIRGGSSAATLDFRAGDGRSALLIAAEHRHPDGSDCAALSALLRAGASAQVARKPDGQTAAHLCAAARCVGCLRQLLTRAPHLVDVHCRSRGEQPLHVAARYGASECAAELCALGARIDAGTLSDGPSMLPIVLACQSRSRRTVRQLLEARASAAARDSQGRSPIHYASKAGATKVVRELMQDGAGERRIATPTTPHRLDLGAEDERTLVTHRRQMAPSPCMQIHHALPLRSVERSGRFGKPPRVSQAAARPTPSQAASFCIAARREVRRLRVALARRTVRLFERSCAAGRSC